MPRLLDTELEKLREYMSARNQLAAQIAGVEANIQQLRKEKERLVENFIQIQDRFQEYCSMLNAKYGAGEIDITTGEIKPKEVEDGGETRTAD